MLGWRVVRTAALDLLESKLAFAETRAQSADARADGLRLEVVTLLKDLALLNRALGAAQGMRDLLIERKNTLELENAQFRSKLTGFPTSAPQIATGNALGIQGLGPDLFDDVGDEKARELGLKDDNLAGASLADLSPT